MWEDDIESQEIVQHTFAIHLFSNCFSQVLLHTLTSVASERFCNLNLCSFSPNCVHWEVRDGCVPK